jgi:hypothetical protein
VPASQVHVEHPRVSLTPVLIAWLWVKPRPAGQVCVPLVMMHRWKPLAAAVGTQTPAFEHAALETTESAQRTPCPVYWRPGTFVIADGVHAPGAYWAGALTGGELQLVAEPTLPLVEKLPLWQEPGVVTSHEQLQVAAAPLGPS